MKRERYKEEDVLININILQYIEMVWGIGENENRITNMIYGTSVNGKVDAGRSLSWPNPGRT